MAITRSQARSAAGPAARTRSKTSTSKVTTTPRTTKAKTQAKKKAFTKVTPVTTAQVQAQVQQPAVPAPVTAPATAPAPAPPAVPTNAQATIDRLEKHVGDFNRAFTVMKDLATKHDDPKIWLAVQKMAKRLDDANEFNYMLLNLNALAENEVKEGREQEKDCALAAALLQYYE